MKPWPEITCPHCGTKHEGPKIVRTECGACGGDCACTSCGRHFDSPTLEYWKFLELDSAPPD